MMASNDGRPFVREKERKYDANCSHYRFLFDDLTHDCSFSDHYCSLRPYVGLAGSDYELCDQENHNNCRIFLDELARRQEILANLEGAD